MFVVLLRAYLRSSRSSASASTYEGTGTGRLAQTPRGWRTQCLPACQLTPLLFPGHPTLLSPSPPFSSTVPPSADDL